MPRPLRQRFLRHRRKSRRVFLFVRHQSSAMALKSHNIMAYLCEFPLRNDAGFLGGDYTRSAACKIGWFGSGVGGIVRKVVDEG
jgi:hypothetical protein